MVLFVLEALTVQASSYMDVYLITNIYLVTSQDMKDEDEKTL